MHISKTENYITGARRQTLLSSRTTRNNIPAVLSTGNKFVQADNPISEKRHRTLTKKNNNNFPRKEREKESFVDKRVLTYTTLARWKLQRLSQRFELAAFKEADRGHSPAHAGATSEKSWLKHCARSSSWLFGVVVTWYGPPRSTFTETALDAQSLLSRQ